MHQLIHASIPVRPWIGMRTISFCLTVHSELSTRFCYLTRQTIEAGMVILSITLSSFNCCSWMYWVVSQTFDISINFSLFFDNYDYDFKSWCQGPTRIAYTLAYQYIVRWHIDWHRIGWGGMKGKKRRGKGEEESRIRKKNHSRRGG